MATLQVRDIDNRLYESLKKASQKYPQPADRKLEKIKTCLIYTPGVSAYLYNV